MNFQHINTDDYKYDFKLYIDVCDKHPTHLKELSVTPYKCMEKVTDNDDYRLFLDSLSEYLTDVDYNLNVFDHYHVVFGFTEYDIKTRKKDYTFDFYAKNDKYFTLEEFIKIMEFMETQYRKKNLWFDSIDTSHIFYEGIEFNGTYWVFRWGS